MPPIRHVRVPGSVPPRGYEDGSVTPDGSFLALGGHVAFDSERVLQHPGDLLAQLDVTLGNLAATLTEAGFSPADLLKLTIHVTDVAAWRAAGPRIGTIWRKHLGKAFCAMTLIGVTELMEPGAVLEIDGYAAR